MAKAQGAARKTSNQRMLVRQWEVINAISSSRLGLTLKQLERETGRSRSTVYRDLGILRDAGVPLENNLSNGEARYRLMASARLPAVGLSALQIAALHLARTELELLAGGRADSEQVGSFADGQKNGSGSSVFGSQHARAVLEH